MFWSGLKSRGQGIRHGSMRFFVLMSRLRSDRQANLFKNVLETTFLKLTVENN
jgi:hypothetical protein